MTLDVDKRVIYAPEDEDKEFPITLIGEATQGPDGKWTCLANFLGMLVRMEIKVTPDWEGDLSYERARRLELD